MMRRWVAKEECRVLGRVYQPGMEVHVGHKWRLAKMLNRRGRIEPLLDDIGSEKGAASAPPDPKQSAPKKKRGRPKGSKNKTSSAKRRGRPPKKA